MLQESTLEENPSLFKVGQAIERIDPITEHLDQIINEMRVDMGIDNIDLRLKKRAN
jgi:hypothetical protein